MEQHIEHAHGFADVIEQIDPHPTSILDLGSGGGIPGLILAERFPEAIVTLLDGRAGRIVLLQELAEALGWGFRLQIVGERAERFGQLPGSREAYQFVVARGFARPGITAECGAPLLAPAGALLVSEPPVDPNRPPRWDVAGLSILGLEHAATEARTFHYAVLVRTGQCPPEFPRKIGIPEKRPLF